MTSQIIAFLLLSSIGAINDDIDPAELRKAVIESRERLTSGVFEIESIYDLEGFPQKRHTYFVAFDGASRRTDSGGPAYLDNYDGSSLVKNCVNQSEWISWDNIPNKDKETLNTIKLNSIVSKKVADSKSIESKLIDVRILGIVPCELGLTSVHPLRDFWGSWQGKVESEAVRPIVVDKKQCLEYSWTSSVPTGRFQGKVVVSPEQGYAVLRSEVRVQSDQVDLTQSMENRVAPFGAPEVWIPVESHFTSTEGGRVRREQKLAIRPSMVNQAIDPKLFTLQGMNIPEGTRFLVSPSAKIFNWDGSKLVEVKVKPRRESGEEEMAAFEEERRRGAWRTAGIVVGVIGCLGLIGVVFFRRRRGGA